ECIKCIQWVKIAKNAGMKYIVITSKHHDGFAMFGSKVNKYNIVDATPFGRDPMKELAAACQKEGLRLCFYYSHVQDWHDPDAVGNDWDFPDDSKKNFTRYFEELVKPHVKELLTNYGPIGLIWFDTPYAKITPEQSKELVDFVHQLQPACLVNGRVGHGQGDYKSLGDNKVPGGEIETGWETPATMNHTWGYKKNDNDWKSTETLLQLLADIVSKGGNYLLNVGPTAEGIIPQPSVDRLGEIGKWLEVNGEAIYATQSNPYPYEFEWGVITEKPGKLYLNVFKWPQDKQLVLNGLRNSVKNAYILSDKKKSPLKLDQKHDVSSDIHSLKIKLPNAAPDKGISVIVLDIEGKVDADKSILVQSTMPASLESFLADIHKTSADTSIKIDDQGIINNWFNEKSRLSWNIKVMDPGSYEVVIITTDSKSGDDNQKNNAWEEGHKVSVSVNGQNVNCTMIENSRSTNIKTPYLNDIGTNAGRVSFTRTGNYQLELKPEKIVATKKLGLRLRSIKLVPVKQ
ncbi:MAG: alpha-L-fucosidase, partial [Patescibacteria group bacterium]|nr:alpha-L-fucosidase [Patescibacteria group bacterium]